MRARQLSFCDLTLKILKNYKNKNTELVNAGKWESVKKKTKKAIEKRSNNYISSYACTNFRFGVEPQS